MLVVAVVVLVLPFALMLAFNGRDRADSRGARVDNGWRVSQKI